MAASSGSGKGRQGTHVQEVPVKLAADQAKPGEKQPNVSEGQWPGTVVSNNADDNFAVDADRTAHALKTAQAQIKDATGAGVPEETATYTHFPIGENHVAPSRRDVNAPVGSTPKSVIANTVEPLAAPLQRPMKDAKRAQADAAPVGVAPQATPAGAQEGVPIDRRHLGVVDKDGNALDLKSVLEKNTGPGNTFRVTRRVFEEIKMPGTEVTSRRLLFPENAVVSEPVAEQMLAALDAAKLRNAAS